MATEPNIDDMLAGAELDALAATEVMGWHKAVWHGSGYPGHWPNREVWVDERGNQQGVLGWWQPSTNLEQAFRAADVLMAKYWLNLHSPFRPGDPWVAGFTLHGVTGWNGRPDWQAAGDTPALAITRAAVKAKMAEKGDKE